MKGHHKVHCKICKKETAYLTNAEWKYGKTWICRSCYLKEKQDDVGDCFHLQLQGNVR
jgi:hypothetical protein